MSRNLENEYKEAVLKDLPDLWDRIEAALPTEQVTSAQNDESKSESTKAETVKTEEKKIENKQTSVKKKKHKIWPYFAVALPIAALGLIAIVPATAILLNLGIRKMSFSDSAQSFVTLAPMAKKDESPAADYMEDSCEYESVTGAFEENYDSNDCGNEAANVCDSTDSVTETKDSAATQSEKKGMTENLDEEDFGEFCAVASVSIVKLYEDENGNKWATIKFVEKPEALNDGFEYEIDDVIDAEVLNGDDLTEDEVEIVSILCDEEGNYRILAIGE